MEKEDVLEVEQAIAKEPEVVEEEPEQIILKIDKETIADEEEDESTSPAWVKELRKSHRESQKKLREYERKLQEMETAKATQSEEIILGPEPTPDQFDYDDDKYKAALRAHFLKQTKIEAQKAEKQAQAQAQAQAWQVKVDAYQAKKKAAPFKDFEDVEGKIMQTMTPDQQAMLIDTDMDPTLLVYAIGKNPERLAKFAGIKDPARFLRELGRLEAKLVVEKTSKPKPAPETVVKGGTSSVSKDKRLDKLTEEAMKTGNVSKLVAYKNELRLKR